MRLLSLFIGIGGLVVVYLFKGNFFIDPWEDFVPLNDQAFPLIQSKGIYILHKYVRFILNDAFMLLVIYTLFPHRSTLQLGLIIFLFGALILLPSYLVLAFNPSEFTVHYLHHLHRITMNPIIMLLLLPGIYLHRRRIL